MNEERREAYLNLIQALLDRPSEEANQILQAKSELVDTGLVQVMLEKKERRQAYLNLIRSLLDCPNGEESQILQVNSELIDAELVQVMLEEAKNLRTNNNLDKANSLMTLAGYLLGIYSNTMIHKLSPSTYRKFLTKVLQAMVDSKGDRNVTYPLLRDNLKLVNDNLAVELQNWVRETLPNLDSPEKRINIISCVVNLSLAIAEFPLGSIASNLEIAIAGYEIALRFLTGQEYPKNYWATVQNNLGLAYIERIRGEKADNIEMAISALQAALSVRTREAFPENWATTQNNLGLAYSNRIRGEKADNLEKAIAIYQESLSVYTRKAFPKDWAWTQHNLAVTYSNRIRGEKADNLERAISACEAALEIHTRETYPEDWARTQNILAAAYFYRIKGEKADNLERAIALYQSSLEIHTREAFPEDWANTQNSLAAAYSERIRGEKADNLETAIALYQKSLEVCTREAFPFKWAITQMNLAAAYRNRIRGEKADNIEIAIALYQTSLEIRTREAFPEKWANTQNSLAAAYSQRIRGEKAVNIETAIALYQKSLEVCTREGFPQYWANTQVNLADTYRQRIRGEKADNLEKAIAFYKLALSVCTREAFPQDWAAIQNNLGLAYNNRIRGEKAENLEIAIAFYKLALSVCTREAFPQDWAMIQNNLGLAYTERIRGERADNFEMAIPVSKVALLVFTPEGFRKDWAMTQSSLGFAYHNRIRGEKAENLEIAIAAYQASLSVYTREAFPIYNTGTLSNIGLAYWDNSQLSEAYNSFKSAIETVELMRSEIIIGGEADKQKLAEEYNRIYQQMVEVCLAMENSTAALEYVERSKTRNLVELFHKARSLPSQVQRISFAEIRSLLAENEAILEWYITYNNFKVFIITRDSNKPDVWQSSDEDLQALKEFSVQYIDDYIEGSDNWGNQLEARLEKLAEILHIDEIIARYIPETCQKLILVPFRYLHLFPLHSLASKRQQANSESEETGCLLELFPGGVRYTPSCQLLQLSGRLNPTGEDSSPTKLFAIQNPTEDLDFTDIEVEAIAKSFNPAEILSRQQANKTALQQQLATLQNADIAHFSCHGFFYFLDPRKSALILAGGKIATDNVDSENKSYIRLSQDELLDIEKCLTLEEIFDLPLSKCSLVTLSACDTGLTDIRDNTDEYIGLPSGFLYAGTTNVISTLWAVNVVSTAILMIKFYEIFLSETRPPVAVALRESQLWLRDATVQDLVDWADGSKLLDSESKERIKKNYKRSYNDDDRPCQSPVYWAAFCAVGQ
jgi:CHAT domain-containing protein